MEPRFSMVPAGIFCRRPDLPLFAALLDGRSFRTIEQQKVSVFLSFRILLKWVNLCFLLLEGVSLFNQLPK